MDEKQNLLIRECQELLNRKLTKDHLTIEHLEALAKNHIQATQELTSELFKLKGQVELLKDMLES